MLRILFASVVLLAAAAPALRAEAVVSSRAVCAGVVVDGTGAVIRNAIVIYRAGSDRREERTDAEGRFTFAPAATGATVTATADGFEAVTLDAIGETRIVLAPLGVTERVDVSANLPGRRTSSATRTDTPLRDVPQAVSQVSRDLIVDQGMQGMTDVVRYMPGVGMAQGEGNRDTPILRGNSTTGDFFVDGIRDDVQYLRDLYNVERVEALKGPSAMIFGRGGAGGVINRVLREADWEGRRELTLQAGAYGNRRATADLDAALDTRMAGRVTAMLEQSDSWRNGVEVDRYGVNPTVAFALGTATTLRAGYERFHDERTADRGVPSFNGRPLETDPGQFFGDPARNQVAATVDALSGTLDHDFGGGVTVRSRLRWASYDKFYQNLVPGAVNAARTSVAFTAYNNATQRDNLFSQTDLVATRQTGPFAHVVMAGVELGRQVTDNRRLTGFFNGTAATINVPLTATTTFGAVDWRPSATDGDNHGVARVGALYAQDQVSLGEHWQAVLGLRFDHFTVAFHDNRTNADLSTTDDKMSPRLGLVWKPRTEVSVYASWSRAFVPRAGDQLSSLNATTQALEPEEFRNREVGVKWDVTPRLSASVAGYQLDRSNVAVSDPTTPGRSFLVDGQQVRGIEVEVTGRVLPGWSLTGGYAFQDGTITSSLSATALEGATVAQLPRHSFSLWNRVDVHERVGLGLGVQYRSDMFTSTDNTVVLPGYTRVDAAAFVKLTERLSAQVNMENVGGATYWMNANGNNNILPGSPRAARVLLTSRF